MEEFLPLSSLKLTAKALKIRLFASACPKRKGSPSSPIHFRGKRAVSFREGTTIGISTLSCTATWSCCCGIARDPRPAPNNDWLVVSKIFYFHLYLGKWSNLTSIFFKWIELKPPTRWLLNLKVFLNAKKSIWWSVDSMSQTRQQHFLLLWKSGETWDNQILEVDSCWWQKSGKPVNSGSLSICFRRLQISPLKPQRVPMDQNIWFQGLAQGQIYNPVLVLTGWGRFQGPGYVTALSFFAKMIGLKFNRNTPQ